MLRPGQQLDRFVEDAGGLDAVGESGGRDGEGAEGGVDRALADRGDGRARVEQGHHVELGLGVRAVEVAQQAGRPEPPPDDIDAQVAAAGTHRGGGPLRGLQELAGVRQERVAVGGELDTARHPHEQPRAEALFQGGDALGDGLLGDGQAVGGFGELARIGDGDEGAHGLEVHD